MWENILKKVTDAMKSGSVKKAYRDSESLYDDFYGYLEELNALIPNMQFNSKEGDLINEEEMEEVLNHISAAYYILSSYY